jgi:dTMP kinase
MFITLDGGDGCGKSTQIQLLGDWLKSQGHDVILCRDPGSTPLGNAVRNILLHERGAISSTAEMLLFMAARSQLVEEIIRPVLKAGKDVVSDRFLLSNIVYQGYAGGVPLTSLEAVGQIATGGLLPDLGLVLDIPYETAIKRVGNRSVLDRMEQKGEEYHRRVRDGFLQHVLQYAATDPNRYVVVDADLPPDAVSAVIREIVQQRLL